MASRSRRLPWESHSILPSRRKTMRLKVLRADDFNNWLSEYQRCYKNPNIVRPAETPAWVPIYYAQLKQKAERGTCGWAVGAGDGPVDVTSSRDQGSAKTKHRACYHHQHSHHHCHRNSQQHDTSNDKRVQNFERGNKIKSQKQQKQQQVQSQAQHSESNKSPSTPADDTGHLWNTPSEVVDSKLRTRARSDKNRARSDSGLTNPSVALCLWKATSKANPAPFACLPWQMQATQMALEESNYAQPSY